MLIPRFNSIIPVFIFFLVVAVIVRTVDELSLSSFMKKTKSTPTLWRTLRHHGRDQYNTGQSDRD